MRPPPGRLDDRGFALVEALTVLFILGILARLSLPAIDQVGVRIDAARIAGEFQAIRVAALNYNADTRRWPADAAPGVVPSELVPYLEDGFTLEGDGWVMDWDRFDLPDGLPGVRTAPLLVGVSVHTPDPVLGAAVEDVLGSNRPHFGVGSRRTYLLQGL